MTDPEAEGNSNDEHAQPPTNRFGVGPLTCSS